MNRWLIGIPVLAVVWLLSTLCRADNDTDITEVRRVVDWTPAYPLRPLPVRYHKSAHETGVFCDETVMIQGRQRRFRLVVPANYTPERPIGILFGFQGAGPVSTNFLWSTGFEDFAEEAYWIAACLGVDTHGVYENDVFDESENPDLQFFQEVLSNLRSDYVIDENRLYASGFSNGANFCQTLTFTYPGLFAAINPNMGVRVLPPREGSQVACIASGGTRDETWHSTEYNQRLYEAYIERGLDVRCYEFPVAHKWPRPDPGTAPACSWTETVVDYFLRHSRESQAENTAGSRCPIFTDPFESAGLDGLRWRKERFIGDGRFFVLNHCDLLPVQGRLHGHTCGDPGHAVFCFSRATARPVQWSLNLELRASSPSMEIYPLVMRGRSGRMLALRLTPGGWSWLEADHEVDFRRRTGLRELARGVVTLEPGIQYTFCYGHGTAPHWQLKGERGEVLAESDIAQPPVAFDDAEFGFGMRGAALSLDFDNAALSLPTGIDSGAYAGLLSLWTSAYGFI